MHIDEGVLVFSGFGIDIAQKRGVFFIRYDAGEIADKIVEQEITKEESVMAQQSEKDAYKVIIVAQGRAKI